MFFLENHTGGGHKNHIVENNLGCGREVGNIRFDGIFQIQAKKS